MSVSVEIFGGSAAALVIKALKHNKHIELIQMAFIPINQHNVVKSIEIWGILLCKALIFLTQRQNAVAAVPAIAIFLAGISVIQQITLLCKVNLSISSGSPTLTGSSDGSCGIREILITVIFPTRPLRVINTSAIYHGVSDIVYRKRRVLAGLDLLQKSSTCW